MKQKVLFIGEPNRELPEYKAFSEKFECIDYTITSKEQLIRDFETKLADVEAIYGAWLGFIPVGGFEGEVLERAPKKLKIVAICSVGYDFYDIEKMSAKGVLLTNVPSTNSAGPVADLVLFNTLASFRNFYPSQQFFINNIHHTVKARAALQFGAFDHKIGRVQPGSGEQYAYGETLGGYANLSPAGHHVVIVGFGQIGQLIGSRLANIGMHIHYVKRTKLTADQESELGYKAEFHHSLQDTTGFADLVVIAAPGTPETKGMVNKEIIDKFQKPFRLINVGRGSIVDEQALVDGLKAGKVLFAGLDVFEQEPAPHPDLLGRQDVILTPHVGASTVENFDYTASQAMRNIEDVLGGGSGLNVVSG